MDEFIKSMDKMYRKLKRKRVSIIKLIPLIITVFLACVFIYTLTGRLEPDGVSFKDADLIGTILIMLLFFVFKALTIFVVSPVLIYGLAGVMFDTPVALAVVVAGILIELFANYLMGRFLGRVYVERLIYRVDEEGKFIEKLKNLHNSKMSIFLMRFIGFPPISITSIYLSAYDVKFGTYVFYSILGMLPKGIIVTVAGNSIRDPGSPAFMFSVAGIILLCVIVFFIQGYKKA